MKKMLLSFLSLMGSGFAVVAQSHINIELLSATYTAPAVQFRVSWSSIPAVAGQIHNSKIWLWVDFIKIENNQPSGTWTRATVANPSSGTVASETNKGFWLQGNNGNYNQIVTVTLDNIPANTTFNWCAYASDYPPNMVMDGQTYYFKGTSPFILKEADGTIHEIEQTSMPKANLTFVPVSITDKTECPGGLKEVIGVCPYTGTDWYADPNHKCQQRTSGAQNWEAWIKDVRDNELYRIVKMPDNLWWTAEEMRYDASATHQSYKCPNGAQRTIYNYPIIACPAGWMLPTLSNYHNLHNIATDIELLATVDCADIGKGTDAYGFSIICDSGRWDGGNDNYPDGCIADLNWMGWGTVEKFRVHPVHHFVCGACWYFNDGMIGWDQVRCNREL
jgi:hypothetical protein